MARPSKNTDRLLIAAAKELIPETGCTGLNLRQVAAKAGVNLGMFHYHFKTKEEFTRQVLQEVYEEFYTELSEKAGDSGSPFERLQRALTSLGHFTRKHRSLLVALIRDVLNGDQEVAKFMKENFGRHFALILKLVRECKKDGVFLEFPAPVILMLFVVTIGAPHLAVDFLDRSKLISRLGLKKLALQKFILSEKALQQRIQLVFNAVSRPAAPLRSEGQ